MNKRRLQALYFYGAIGSFFVGVAAASLLEIPPKFPSLLLFCLFFSIVILRVRRSSISLFVVPLIIGFLSLGLALTHRSFVKPLMKHTLEVEESLSITIEGVVVSEPIPWSRGERYAVRIDKTDNELVKDSDHEEKVLVFADRYPEVLYGDQIVISGDLILPENFETESGREFGYVNFLAKDKIYYQMFEPEIEIIDHDQGSTIVGALFKIKKAFIRSLQEVLPEPHVSLLGGVTVGAEESLGPDVEENFRKTGLIHIVVLSGYNVTIVAEFIMSIFSFLPRLVSISLGGISIILFALMTGASATIIRASIMACLVLVSKVIKRNYSITRALTLAGFFMVMFNPLILIYDPSFQLSFLATIGLIYVSPIIEKYFRLLPTTFGIREAGVATIATQIFLLPFLIYLMGEVSVISFIVNILVLPVIPLTMLMGLITGVLGFLWDALALPFALVSYGLLAYVLGVVDFFADLSFATLKISWFPFWMVIVFYGIFILLFKKVKRVL